MSTRGTILLAVGMLVLGLLLGVAGGGIAGFFVGRSTSPFVGQLYPPALPGLPNPNPQPRGLPPIQGLAIANGARVVEVEKDSAAAKAGLQVSDVITAVDNVKIDQDHLLADLIKAHKPGDKIDLSVMRGTQTLTINVELGKSPQDSSIAYLGIRYAQLPLGRRFQ